MTNPTFSVEMTQLISESQSMLFAYILSILPDPAAASDVLQETNLVLWRKADELPGIDAPAAWARKIAYFQVLAYRRDKQRDRLLFDDELVAELAVTGSRRLDNYEDRLTQLRSCMQALSEENRQLLWNRYSPGGSVQTIADDLGRSVGAVSQSLYRIRHSLQQCISRSAAEA